MSNVQNFVSFDATVGKVVSIPWVSGKSKRDLIGLTIYRFPNTNLMQAAEQEIASVILVGDKAVRNGYRCCS